MHKMATVTCNLLYLAILSVLSITNVLGMRATCDASGEAVSWVHVGPATYLDDTGTDDTKTLASAGAVQTSVPVGTMSPQRWLAGSVNGGLWLTDDITAEEPHWKSVTDGHDLRCYSISVISVDEANPDIVYAGCGPSTSSEMGTDWNVMNSGDWGGVMLSADAGSTWRMLDFPPNYYVTGIVPSKRLLVAARSQYYKRNDGGIWMHVPDETEDNTVSYKWRQVFDEPVFDMLDVGNGVIIAALPQNANRSVVISKDGGMTWSTFDEGITWPGQELPYYLCLIKDSKNSKVFLGGMTVSSKDLDDTNTRIYHWDVNKGDAWVGLKEQKQMDDDSMPKDRMALLLHPTENCTLYVAGNGDHVAYRVDLCSSPEVWTDMTGEDTTDNSAPHGDCRSMHYNKESGEVVLTSDGGVFARTNPHKKGNGSWRSLNGDITEMEFLSAHWDYRLERYVGGAQDNDVQVGPPKATSSSRSTGVVMGDGTVTAVDNRISPARLFGARQCLGVGPSDRVNDEKKEKRSVDPGFMDGLAFVQGAGKDTIRVGIDLGEKGFGASTCFPYFVQPYTLNSQDPSQLVFWANCTPATDSTSTFESHAGFYAIDIPDGTTNSSQLKPRLLKETPAGATVYTFVSGGFTDGASNPDLLVGMNATHFFKKTSTELIVSPFPFAFAAPRIFDLDSKGAPIVGPISHDKTVSIAVSPRSSEMAVVTGWPSIKENSGTEHILLTEDGGEEWKDVVGNLDIVTNTTSGKFRASGLLIIDFEPKVKTAKPVSGVLVGTVSGPYMMWSDAPGIWFRVGSCETMPFSYIKGLSYEHYSDTLVAASMGRGIFVMKNAKNELLKFRPHGAIELTAESSAKYFPSAQT